MAEIIKGADVAAGIKERISDIIRKEGITPRLGIVKVGNNESDAAYEKGILKTCGQTGIDVQEYEMPADISQNEFDIRFTQINEDPDVHGILLFRPLPEGLDVRRASDYINPDKDIDCMSGVNWAKLVTGDEDGFYPCTAEAVIRILDFAGVKYEGAKAVVIGRSQVIGKPVGLMLLYRNATVTWCHSKTPDLSEQCRNADILVSACGKAEMVDEKTVSEVSPGCMAVDVGVNFKDGRMCGDLNFEQVSRFVQKITPVPGGVGAVTNSVLAAHVVRAACKSVKGIDIII